MHKKLAPNLFYCDLKVSTYYTIRMFWIHPYLDNEVALFGVQTWEIWCQQERMRIKKIWTRLGLWKPSSLFSQGRSRARKGGAHTKAPLGYKYNP
jgi:hypothetical protein